MGRFKQVCIASSMFVLITIGACATSPTPTIKYDADADFATYRTFAWVEDNPINADGVLRSVGPFAQKEIRQAVVDELAGKGVSLIEHVEKADLAVFVTLGQRDEYALNNYLERVHVYAPRVRRVNSVSYVTTGQSVDVYSEGSVSIDMLDNKEGYSVWHGHISDEVKPAVSVSDSVVRLRDAIELLLSDYPPDLNTE